MASRARRSDGIEPRWAPAGPGYRRLPGSDCVACSGGAAVRVAPDSAETVAAGIAEALLRRDELVERGIAHARRFTWADTGRVHLQSYADAL